MNSDQTQSFLKQAKYVARILLSFHPVAADLEYVFLRKTLQGRFGIMKKGWYKQVTPLGTSGYIYYSGTEQGEFSPTLPEGVTVEGVLSTAEEKRVVSTLFATAVNSLENNKIFSRSFSSCLLLHIQEPAVVDCQLDTEDEKDAVNLLKGTLGVLLYPGYNSLLLRSLKIGISKLPRDLRDYAIFFRMQEFIKRLAEDRKKYAIDGKFLGEILAANMLCYLFAEAASSKEIDDKKDVWIWNYYNMLIEPILNSAVRSEEFFRLVIKKVLEAGGVDTIWSLADEYREFVFESKERALNSKTHDEFSEILYSAIPSGWAAFMMYLILSENPEYLNTKQKNLVNKLRKSSDEILVRIRQPLLHQLFDFDLAFWNYTKAHIKEVERKMGIHEAEREAKKIVEARMTYPRSFLPKLLDQEPENPQIIS